MAQPATDSAEVPQGACSAPLVVHPVDEKLPLTRLCTDGVATLHGPVSGGFPTSAFAQNAGVVSLPRVRSRYVAAAGGTLLSLGVFPVPGSGISAGALAAVSLIPFLHHLGTRSRTAVALKST